MTRSSVQEALDWCREEVANPSRNWDHKCLMMARSAWGQQPWAYSANLAWARVPEAHRHYTHFSKVPAGAVCFGLFNSKWGHAWISARGDAGFSVDYKARGRIDRAPVNLPSWTGSDMVHWTDWSPFGMLPIWEDARNVNLRPKDCKAKPQVQVSNVRPGKTHSDVGVVQRALEAEFKANIKDKDNYYGKETDALYRKWQIACGLVPTAPATLPGKVTLTKLGAKHNFVVI